MGLRSSVPRLLAMSLRLKVATDLPQLLDDVLPERRQDWPPEGRGREMQTLPTAAFFSLGPSQAPNPPGQTQGRTTVAAPPVKPLPRESTPKSTETMSVEGETVQGRWNSMKGR